MNTLPSNVQQPNAGIATGNPQPLPTQQPKQAQQQFDLSKFPDLATALRAMKAVQDEKNKQVQQGLQAGAQAQQPSVIEQLNQTLQRIEGEKHAKAQQAAGLAQLFAAAKQGSGTGVDQLPANLGEGYAGGGIVAFAGPDGSKVEGEEDPSFWERVFAGLGELAPSTSGLRRSAADARSADAKAADWLQQPSGGPHNRMGAPAEDDRTKRDPSNYRPYGVQPPTTDPRYEGGGNRTSASAKTPVDSAKSPFLTDMEELSKKAAGIDPYAKSSELDAKYKKMLDMDTDLADRRSRAAETKALMEQQRDSRNPLATWLLAAGASDPSKPFAMQMGAGASAYNTAQQGWAKEDLANKQAINKMLDDIATAKMQGNEKLVDASQKGLTALLQQQSSGLTAGAHLAGTEESARARIQSAAIAHAELAQRIKQGQDDKDMATLARLEQMAQQAGTARANMDRQQISGLAIEEVQSRAAQYAYETLRDSTDYRRLLKKHDINMIVPQTTKAPTTDLQGFKVRQK